MAKSKWCLGFYFLLSFYFASAQNISDAKLDTKLSVLNNKAYFNFPAGAANVERPANIMSAGYNPNEETRIIYNSGKMRLVFFAQELYLISDKNLFTELSSDSAYRSNFVSKVFTNNDTVYSILSTPLKYDSSQGGILIKSLLVQTPDSTLFRIDAYINSDAFSKKAEFQVLAENVFRTLAKGSRTNKRNERDEQYFLLDSTKAFSFHLPVNYCITVDQKYDFKVFKFHKFRRFTDNSWADMLIYVGDHPSYIYMEYGLDERAAKKDSGMFLGNKTQWMLFTDDMQGIFLKEQILKQDEVGVGEQMHVAMLSNKQEPLPELTKIAEEVKLLTK